MIKQKMPPEHLKKLVYELKNNPNTKNLFLGAIKYLPRSIYFLLANLPFDPDESENHKVIYHVSGILTSIFECKKVYANDYKKKISHELINENRNKTFPIFDDDDPIYDYQMIKNIDEQTTRVGGFFRNKVVDIDTNKQTYEIFKHKQCNDNQLTLSQFNDKQINYNQNNSDQFNHSQITDKNADNSDFFDYHFLNNARILGLQITNGPIFYKQPIVENICIKPQKPENRVEYPFLYNKKSKVNPIPLRNTFKVIKNVTKKQYKHQINFFNEIDFLKEKHLIKNNEIKNSIKNQETNNPINNQEINNPIKNHEINNPINNHEINNPINNQEINNPINNQETNNSINNNEINSSINNYDLSKSFKSVQNLLKSKVRNIKRMGRKKHKSKNIYKELIKTRYFQITELSWLEAGLQLIQQGQILLNNILKKKKISFYKLDNNFNLKLLRMITTKERKRSRVGHSFHILREYLKITKYVLDVFVIYRLKRITKNDFYSYLYSLFTNIGTFTGLYRYKYKTMKQIKKCKDVKNIQESIIINYNVKNYNKNNDFNNYNNDNSNNDFNIHDDNLINNNIYKSFIPHWKIWVSYFRTHITLLEEFLENLIYRMSHGRESKPPTITKQRIESHYDLYMKEKLAETILTITPEGVVPHIADILRYFSEAWKFWKSNLEWNPDLKEEYKKIIDRFIIEKSKRYKERVIAIRKYIIDQKVDNVVIKKNLGRLTRLYIKKENERQIAYLTYDDIDNSNIDIDKSSLTAKYKFIDIKTALEIYNYFFEKYKEIEIIKFPDNEYVNDHKFLTLAIKRLKNENSKEILEQKIIDSAFENPEIALKEIKKRILTQRTFNEIQISLKDNISQVYPVYHIDIFERLTDAYIDHYVCYELYKQGFYNRKYKGDDYRYKGDDYRYKVDDYRYKGDDYRYKKYKSKDYDNYNNHPSYGPNDDKIFILEILEMIKYLNLKKSDIIVTAKISHVMENIDINLLSKLLSIVIDPIIVNYITSRLNCNLNYKDMQFSNFIGCLKGFEFSGFISDFYYRIVDYYLERKLKFYYRYHNEIFFVINYEDSGNDYNDNNFINNDYKDTNFINNGYNHRNFINNIDSDFINKDSNFINNDSKFERTYKQKYFNFLQKEKIKYKSLHYEVLEMLNNTLPNCIGRFFMDDLRIITIDNDNYNDFKNNYKNFKDKYTIDTNNNDYNYKNDNIFIAKNDFKIFEFCKINFCLLNSKYYSMSISNSGIQIFINHARTILKSSTRNTFLKIVQKWNKLLLSTVVYYRESISGEFIEIIKFYERKIQNSIKLGLNTKMPSRFPNVIFYAPTEVGGLGMLSIGVEDDFEFFKKNNDIKNKKINDNTNKNIKNNINDYFNTNDNFNNNNENINNNNKDDKIPSILNYIKPWIKEIEDSKIAYQKYLKTGKISHDIGIPRINTLFNLENDIHLYDHGYRMRNLYKKYTGKNDYFNFISLKHDGKLWNIDNYRKEIIKYFGGIDKILENTLFSATNYFAFDSLFWENQKEFSNNFLNRKMTNVQKAGVNQIPNKRFAFWWSPTINRNNVYIGYETQLDTTKIKMHGKLSTIKGNYLNVFRNNLWQKIHESIVKDIFYGLNLNDFNVRKEIVYPKKSIRMMGGSDLIVSEVCDVYLTDICGCKKCGNVNIIENSSGFKIINDNINFNNDNFKNDNFDNDKNNNIKFNNDTFNNDTFNTDNLNINKKKDNKISNNPDFKDIWIDVQLKWGDYDFNDIKQYSKELYLNYSSNSKFYSSKYGSIIAFDLCYNTYHTYGYLNSSLKNKLINILSSVHKNNRMLNILRERIRKSIQLYEQRVDHINEISEIFNYHIIDDTLKSIIIFNPKTGLLIKCGREELSELLYKMNINKVIAKTTAPIDDTSIVTMSYDFPIYKISPFIRYKNDCKKINDSKVVNKNINIKNNNIKNINNENINVNNKNINIYKGVNVYK
ncbi:Pre-mRNA-splicing factor spp42 [Dictyocoela muelleri]|nr:Pre-mRNA-splicing factor spp42 [Dictyocoela muelleri]